MEFKCFNKKRKGKSSVSVKEKIEYFSIEPSDEVTLSVLFKVLIEWCRLSDRKLVLIIDEVDTASNNQVFIDFLAQLRAYYLKRKRTATFQSVILAGVHDIKNMKQKLRAELDHKTNSPWNIAADFLIDMSFSKADIIGMLKEYETDHHTDMNIDEMSGFVYDYTSGYPYLVSRLCKLIDERIAGSADFPSKQSAWTKQGFLEALKILLNESNSAYIKPFTTVRRAWLFADTPKSATALDVFAYLKYLLTEIPNNQHLEHPEIIDDYLPWSASLPDECRLNYKNKGLLCPIH